MTWHGFRSPSGLLISFADNRSREGEKERPPGEGGSCWRNERAPIVKGKSTFFPFFFFFSGYFLAWA